jgi:hypothetical protein
MEVLACFGCGERFYVAGVATAEHRRCPGCGRILVRAGHGVADIPLDARWLDRKTGSVDRPGVTVVGLRRRSTRGRRGAKRIVTGLADYFRVDHHGQHFEVRVDGGQPEEAALRVAAVLDGVDPGWERYFHLPRAKPSAELSGRPA